MNLAIDVGNTRTKAGVFKGTELQEVYIDQTPRSLLQILERWPLKQGIISSVGRDHGPMISRLEGKIPIIQLTPSLAVPVSNHYRTPQTLGMDRLAAVVGAREINRETSNLVIDAGTSITYDLIDEKGNYQGGGISPGINLRFKSLNSYTSKLPLITDKSAEVPLIGTDTASSIRSGVLNGATAEIEGIIQRYLQKYPKLKVLLCGGDADFFESTLKPSIFVVPNLVLSGLNRILLYHVQEKG